MDPVRVGVVGCGVIGPTHMAAAQESSLIDLVAVADLIEERATSAAEKFGAAKVYTDGTDLIADPDVELVVLAFPAETRTALGLLALNSGKHLLTEKPVAMNRGEVRQLMAAQGDLYAATCCCRFRFMESAQAATEFIATGALGELRNVYCRELRAAGPMPTGEPVEWRLKKQRNGGGILMNWGCYDLDYLLGLCGWSLKPLTVFGQTWTCPPQFESHIAEGADAETYYTALIRCEDGTIINVERGEYMATAAEAAWQIIGTRGSLQLHMLPGQDKQIVFNDTSTETGVESRVIWEGDDGKATTAPVTNMAEAIRQGSSPATPLEHALVVQQISDAIYASAEGGTSVTLE